MRRLLLTGAALACCASLAGEARAGATYISFLTPSRNIGCGYASGLGGPRSLRCDIASGLVPRPGKPRGCRLNWGDSYTMNATGRALVTCHGDTAIIPGSKVLAYGTSWTRGGFTCRSRATGLRCENRSGHGFFLSRGHSYRF